MPEEQLSFDEFLALLRENAQNTTHQGRQFEIAMVALLPQLKEFQIAEAWLWRDWPQRETTTGLSAKDIGIDIVARIRDSDEFWAVQCKFYNPGSQITQRELGTFYAASGHDGFSGRLIITTTDNWSQEAEDRLKNQHIEPHRLRLSDLRDLDIGWNWVRPDQTRILSDKRKSLYARQQEALDAAVRHFENHDRGQLIMACGTGKTFTSLKIAESLVPENGSVLFVVPSLSLMKQTINEWAWERSRECRYLGICSDDTVGKQDEESTQVADIPVPVSTNPNSIASFLNYQAEADCMSVAFCTYQSLEKLSIGQKMGAPDFDLIICDEAHRTTGIDRESRPGNKTSNSNFVKVHEQDFIRGKKRLYMTATPRIYTETAQSKAVEENLGVYSMDDENSFGSEFFRLGFGAAVKEGLLSDYKVIVLNIAQDYIAKVISRLDKDVIKALDPTTDDASKIIGCYKALRDQGKEEGGVMLKRAVSFSNSIKRSKTVRDKFNKVVRELDAIDNDGFTCELEHVDGTQTALARAQKLDWLRADAPANDDGEVCRILSNARCLNEGVDVPSLDAVLFMNPRKSQVDVVQAVGRVMRKAPGKDYGYVILPVVIPEGEDVNSALDNNEIYAVVWEVLRALRAHDDRLTNMISRLELNQNKSDIITVIGVGVGGDGKDKDAGTDSISATDTGIQLEFGFPEELAGYIFAKIVDKVGDRRYMEQWAKDTANLHDLLVSRIDELRTKHVEVAGVYDGFLDSIRASIHDGLEEDDATSMLAQQLITSPIFDALFDSYRFSQNNVVSTSLDVVLDQIREYGLEAELKDLDQFYESVKSRVMGLDNDEARQKVITELYEKFFATAFPKTSESLGIAYTPIELVDFTLMSTDEVMREEFGRGLSDEGVHVIDPFTGTGSFLVRLLNNPDLVKDSDIHRKFTSELWANEVLLLAYYIASVNIEMAYHQRGERQYESFPGITLTDTFELYEHDEPQFPEMLEGNSERMSSQRKAPIRVVIGNPPWSAGQRSQNDNNANRAYLKLDENIRSSYAKRSKSSNLNALYDSYIRAIRWASDRIGEEGMVAFVTNAGWLDSTSSDGMRLCLEEEFDAIWIFNLRGNARTSGEQRKKESGHVFGQSSRAPVVISLFVKNPAKRRTKAEIRYRDIGNYHKRDKKLKIIRDAGSISGLDWKTISPNSDGDWLNQRDPKFQTFMELGNNDVKRGKLQPTTVFRSFSNGASTNRDAWAYNFCRKSVENNMERMISYYNEQCNKLVEAKSNDPSISHDDVLDNDPDRISWSSSLISAAERNMQRGFDADCIRFSHYRPFNIQHLYLDPIFTHRTAKMFEYFPAKDSQNKLICVTGKGSSNDFGCLIVNVVPNLHTLDTGQSFPRWIYRKDETSGEQVREDNITNHALEQFQNHYSDTKINKDSVFNYIYGVLHANDYRERFASDLRLGLPRIPMAEEFNAFADAGKALEKIHLGWELNGDPLASFNLGLLFDGTASFPEMIPEESYIVKKMSWNKRLNEGLYIKYNQHLSIGPIPEEAMQYTIGNRTPLQWIIDRYQIKTDRDSGIVNDPNDWIAEQTHPDGKPRPDALIELIRRVTYLSVETQKIVDNLPNAVPND